MFSTSKRISEWMFDAALPLWADRGVDRKHGGYVEQLTFDAQDAGVDFKRTRVTARQIYVFSHAAILGWKEGTALAKHGIDFLTTKAWISEQSSFARTVSRTGLVVDPSIDLYDHAFALFAFGWYFKASADPDAMVWAHRTLDAIEHHLRHSTHDGYLHALPAEGWRQQNPHMHLIEAALSVYDASGDERFAGLAREISELFSQRFFDTASRSLAEFYQDDWTRAPAPDGKRIEPGHQFEWAWILNKCHRLIDVDLSNEIRGLVGFAEEYGVDPKTQITFNAVQDDGKPIDKGSRTWPNTERIKGAIALYELDGVNPEAAIAGSANAMFDRHLDQQVPGIWQDAYSANEAPLTENVPASTFYHLFLAFAETLRLFPVAKSTTAVWPAEPRS